MTEIAAPAMQVVEVDGKTKYIISILLTDENGKPLLDARGSQRMTNLTADSIEELVAKQAQSNVELARKLDRSTRRFETLSTRKPTPATPAPKMEGTPLTADEKVQIGLDMQDPRKAADATKRVVESVVPVTQIASEVQRQGKTIDIEARKRIAAEYIHSHPDYYPCDANGNMVNAYLIKNNLEFSIENIDFAVAALGAKLVERPPSQRAPQNDPPPAPDNDAANNEPPRDTPPAQQRRAPAGGLRNSQVSAAPSGELALTRQQALDMLYKDRAKYEAWMRDPVKNAILNRALNSPR